MNLFDHVKQTKIKILKKQPITIISDVSFQEMNR